MYESSSFARKYLYFCACAVSTLFLLTGSVTEEAARLIIKKYKRRELGELVNRGTIISTGLLILQMYKLVYE